MQVFRALLLSIVLFSHAFSMEYPALGKTLKPFRVDTEHSISDGEKSYLAQREQIVQSKMHEFLGGDFQGRLPVNAFCLSGGGYRAMIAGSAFLHAMEDIGLLYASTYMSTLSGSTWLLGHMLIRQKCCKDFLSMRDFRDVLKGNVVNKNFFNPRSLNWKAIIGRMLQIYWQTKNIQPADIWGSILLDRLMCDLQVQGHPIQHMVFSDVKNIIQYPLPIFTAAITDTFPYKWLEANPFVSGGDYLMNQHGYAGAYVPTLNLGCCFKCGEGEVLLPEKSIATWLGIFGSPYSMSIADILKFLGENVTELIAEKVENYWERKILEKLIINGINILCKDAQLYKKRFLPTHVNNFLLGMNSDLGAISQIMLSDAGFEANLPVLPLLKSDRGVDVIVICDASSDAEWCEHPEIVYARDEAKRYGLPFPKLENGQKISDNLFVYLEWDSRVPSVIYFTNAVHESTLKFDYSEKEFDDLYVHMYNSVIQARAVLKKVLLQKATNRIC